jgi:3'-phosphoadenosine 5'-phosphosulfate sulfotransferase (PAPS reductase)/FAD synthetase
MSSNQRGTTLDVTGIRGDESAKRKQMPVAKPQPELTRPSVGTVGWDWHPIAHYTLDDVCVAHVASGLPLHEAYTTWGASRVSCSACVLAARADLLAALGDARNHAAFREIVALELASTFSFKPTLWVADLADALLTDEERAAREHAKAVAARRRAAEARLPEHLLYADGWPVAVPSLEEAALLAAVRQEVAALLGFDDARCLTPDTVRQQYADLLEEKALREARRRPRRRAADQGGPAAPRTTSRATATQFALLL